MKDLALFTVAFSLAIVALFGIAFMVDSSIMWIHMFGVILGAGIVVVSLYFLVLLFQLVTRK